MMSLMVLFDRMQDGICCHSSAPDLLNDIDQSVTKAGVLDTSVQNVRKEDKLGSVRKSVTRRFVDTRKPNVQPC